MGSQGTPEAVLGLDLEGKGFKEVNDQLNQHLKGWEAIEAKTTKIAGHVDGIAGGIGKLAGLSSIGGVIYDFVRLEDVANRVALQMDRITGTRSGFTGTRTALQNAAIATSTDSRDLGSAVGSMVQRVGTRGGVDVQGLATLLGTYSQAYGIDVGALGSAAGDIALFQGQGTGATGQILAQLANQARKSGMAGQTGLFTTTVSQLVASLIGSHPGAVNPGASRQVGAMYGAAIAGNQAFRDPALFGSGMAGIDQGISQAYSNPRMTAMLNMAGVSYWQARNGLAGPGGHGLAKKVLNFSNRMYGSGSIEQDLFLRSNFGDVSADLLKAFGKGEITYEQLMNGKGGAHTNAATHKRAAQSEQTAASRAQKVREGAGKAASGPLDELFKLLDGLGLNDFGGLAEAAGGLWLGKKIGGSALRRAGSRARAKAAQRAAAEAAAEGEKQAGGDAAKGIAKGAARTAARGGGLDLAEILRGGLKGLRGLAVSPEDAPLAMILGLALSNNHNYPTKGPAAGKHLKKLYDQGLIGPGSGDLSLHPAGPQADPRLQGYPDGGAMTGSLRSHHTTDKFGRAVDKFSRTVDALRGPGGSSHASYTGPGGGLNAAGATGFGDGVGSNMVLARMLAGGGIAGGGGGGGSLASFELGAIGAGGGGGGGGGAAGAGGGGAGFKPCLLTYYAPSAGGINGRDGGGAAGVPLHDNSWGCAAPSGYAFGTIIRFAYKGKHVDVPVLDRGGAITGSHFDLLVAPAKALGMFSAGKVNASFKVIGHRRVGSKGANGSRPAGGYSSSGGGGGGGMSTSAAFKWMASGSAGGSSGGGGGGGGGAIVVNVDGREVNRQQRLVRGRA